MPIQKTSPEEIIKNSITVFRRKGYYRTSMADLASESELTKGAFYHYFKKGKEEVMIKSLQAARGWFVKYIFSIAYKKNELSPKERLTAMADAAYTAFTDNLGGCFFANTILETAHVEDTFLSEIEIFFSKWEEALTVILKEKYSEEEAKQMAQRIIVDVEGSIILMQLRKDKKYLKNAIERGKYL